MGKLRDKHTEFKTWVLNPIIELHNNVEDNYKEIKKFGDKNIFANYYLDKINDSMDISNELYDDINRFSVLMHQIALVYDNDIKHINGFHSEDYKEACIDLKENPYFYDKKNGFNFKHLKKEFQKVKELTESACKVSETEYRFIGELDDIVLQGLKNNEINQDTMYKYAEYISNKIEKSNINILYDMKATIGCINSHNNKINDCIVSVNELPDRFRNLDRNLEELGDYDEFMEEARAAEESIKNITRKWIYIDLKDKELKHAYELKYKAQSLNTYRKFASVERQTNFGQQVTRRAMNQEG